MKQVNRDKALKEAAFVKMREEMDQRTRLHNARKDGVEEGEQRGLNIGIAETMKVIRLLNQGISLESISQQVSLSIEQIEEIIQEVNEVGYYVAEHKL